MSVQHKASPWGDVEKEEVVEIYRESHPFRWIGIILGIVIILGASAFYFFGKKLPEVSVGLEFN